MLPKKGLFKEDTKEGKTSGCLVGGEKKNRERPKEGGMGRNLPHSPPGHMSSGPEACKNVASSI